MIIIYNDRYSTYMGGLKTEVHTRYPGLGFQVQAALSAMGQCGGSHWGLGKAESDEVQ